MEILGVRFGWYDFYLLQWKYLVEFSQRIVHVEAWLIKAVYK